MACRVYLQAVLEVKMLASFILQQFTLELVPGHDITYMPAVTISAKFGMLMVPVRRPVGAVPSSATVQSALVGR